MNIPKILTGRSFFILAVLTGGLTFGLHYLNRMVFLSPSVPSAAGAQYSVILFYAVLLLTLFSSSILIGLFKEQFVSPIWLIATAAILVIGSLLALINMDTSGLMSAHIAGVVAFSILLVRVKSSWHSHDILGAVGNLTVSLLGCFIFVTAGWAMCFFE